MATVQMKNFALCLMASVCFLLGNSFLHAAEKERAPVIFVHGLFVPSATYKKIIPLAQVFADNGYTVHVAERPSGGTIVERAAILRDEIKRLVPTGKFHLVGHSAGGFDSRYALWKYSELGERCLSLTTMATPHWGSPVADEIISSVDDGKFDLKGEFFGYLFKKIEGARQLAYEMTTAHAQQFNVLVTNDPRVRYFSMGFYIEQPYYIYTRPIVWDDHVLLVKKGFLLNDGPVPLEHSRWGEPLPDMPGDHMSETSQIKYDNREIFRDIFAKLLQNLDTHF